MTDFYLWMCNLFVLVAYISEELNVVTRYGSCCCLCRKEMWRCLNGFL